MTHGVTDGLYAMVHGMKRTSPLSFREENRCIARGCTSQGESDTSMNALDLSAAVNFVRQQGATQLVLLGASMGGTASLKVAASVPVAAVVTLSAPENFGVAVTEQDLQGMGGAKLFISSQDDTYTADATFMYEQARPPKEIHLYDGAAHGTELFAEYDADLTWRILNFLVGQLCWTAPCGMG
jgi:uncharacterized protein